MPQLTIEKPKLHPQDFHGIFNPNLHNLAIYNAAGSKIANYEAHGEGVNGPSIEVAGGNTVPGLYKVGVPMPTTRYDSIGVHYAYGYWFCPLVDVQGNEAKEGRDGIGIHGGGSAAPDPLADKQGWFKTRGCVRLQNEDNATFVKLVKRIQGSGGTLFFTVENWA